MSHLHPLAVHLPIAVALLWPLVDAAGLLLARADVSRTAAALLGVGVASALAATVTGQSAYDDAIAAGRAPALLDAHADPAGLVPWLLLAVGALRLVGAQKLGRAGHVGAIVAGAAVAAWIGWVGYTGGQLVYEHGVGVSPAGLRGAP